MNTEVTIAQKQAQELRDWLASGGDGVHSIPKWPVDSVKYWESDGPVDIRRSWPTAEFIGGLLYHDALKIEAETGYRVDASPMVDEIYREFTALNTAA